jgi:hypothetical protein
MQCNSIFFPFVGVRGLGFCGLLVGGISAATTMFNHTLLPFHAQQFGMGHSPTNWSRWLQTDTMYPVQFQKVNPKP